MAAQATAKNAPRVGQFFGIPGVTRWTYQPDNNSGLQTVVSQTNSKNALNIIPFYQTDIAFGWKLWHQLAQTSTVGVGGTVNQSQYAPYNTFGPLKLTVNKLYSPIDVQSGIDLAIYNFYRPMRGLDYGGASSLYTAPIGMPNSVVNQANAVATNAYTLTQASPVVPFELPVSLWLDEYFDLTMNGDIAGVDHRVFVSPLYMSGEARVVTPQISYNPGFAANSDQGPFVTSGSFTTQPTYVVTSTLQFNRVGVYASNNLVTMPKVYNWRLALTSKQIAVGNTNKIKIPLRIALNPGGGQLLSLFVRLYDPSSGVFGAPVPLSTVSQIIVTYGSGIVRFFDTVADMQARVMDQHNIILPQGVILYDLALDESQRLTNARALNLYLTDVFIEIDFSTNPSVASYAVLFAETLTFVIDNVAVAVGVAAA